MPRLLLSLAFAALALWHTLTLTVIRAGFELERARIEQQLCENRNRPELGCHGHCVLQKALHQAEQSASDQQRRKALAVADLFLLTPWQLSLDCPVVEAAEAVGRSCYSLVRWRNPVLAGQLQPPDVDWYLS